jgi:hypothetical protein
MSYNVITTSGSTIASVIDGTVNTTATSLTLIGKNYAGYGIFLNENYVKLLENFAYDSAPIAPLTGQIWYDSSSTLLKFYTGSVWKPIHTSMASSTPPSSSIAGDLWWNTASAQLFVYSGSTWVLIGPLTSTGTGTSGPAVETILDTLSGSHVIVRFYVSNATVCIITKDSAFVPQTAISGFPTLYPGMNLSTTINNAQFTGNASNSQALAGLTSSQFLRSDQNTTTSSTFGVLNNTGLTVGGSNNFNIAVVGGAVQLTNQANGSDINLFVTPSGLSRAININGTTRAVTIDTNLAVTGYQAVTGNLNVTGSSNLTSAKISTLIYPATDGTIDIGTSSLKFNNVYATSFIGNVVTTSPATLPSIIKSGANWVGDIGATGNRFANVYAGNYFGNTYSGTTFTGTNFIGTSLTGNLSATSATLTGSLSVNSINNAIAIVNAGSTGVGNIGASGATFNTVFATTFSGVSTTAKYADLAERFAVDSPLIPGTVVELGGLKEITMAVLELSEAVFGVISTLPGFLLNGDAGSDATHPPVAVNGRVPVRVIGLVTKGDRLVSAGNGLARAALRSEMTAFNVLGRALDNKTTEGEGTVEAIVKLNN